MSQRKNKVAKVAGAVAPPVALEPGKFAGRIELRPVADLIPYARNARQHSDEQVAKIAASIRRFGFNNPVLVDGQGVIIAGHGRVLAAKRAGLIEVPVVPLDHLTEAERRAYIIADNRLAEDATWDEDLLAHELDAIQRSGELDLGLIGFKAGELDQLLNRLTAGGSLDGEDEAPPAPAVPISQPGDLWQLGKHRVLCGDSTSPAAVTRLLGGLVPLLMVTDPPYGVEYDPAWRTEAGVGSKGAATGKVLNDDRADWREAWALFPGDVAYVWHGALHARDVDESLRAAGFEVRSQIIWVKSRPVLSRGHYHWQHEPAFFAERGDGEERSPAWVYDHELAAYVVKLSRTGHWHGGRRQSTVWEIDHLKSETGHGTQKPVECMRRPILNNSSPGQAVYDPFLGSGTTLIAAESTSRACYGLELNPAYVDVIVRRWEELTGQQAVLEGSRQTLEQLSAERLGNDKGAGKPAPSESNAAEAA